MNVPRPISQSPDLLRDLPSCFGVHLSPDGTSKSGVTNQASQIWSGLKTSAVLWPLGWVAWWRSKTSCLFRLCPAASTIFASAVWPVLISLSQFCLWVHSGQSAKGSSRGTKMRRGPICSRVSFLVARSVCLLLCLLRNYPFDSKRAEISSLVLIYFLPRLAILFPCVEPMGYGERT